MYGIDVKTSLSAAVICLVSTVFPPPSLLAQPAMLGLRAPGAQAGQQTGSQPQLEASKGQKPEISSTSQAPSLLILPVGTIITVESTEFLSSNQQAAGDNFVAELQQPLIVDGWVVAQPGQTVIGRVVAAKKAGRVKGRSKLSLELQQIILADGRQAPVESELVENNGPTSHGRDAAVIAIATGVGAAVGAVCGAKGAAIGAAVGAGASLTGVLLTRGDPSEIDTEKLLTFRLAAALAVPVDESQHSFWKVTSDDFIVPRRILNAPPGGTGTVAATTPGLPASILLETETLAAGRPGRNECSR
jgi:hypothetical protein